MSRSVRILGMALLGVVLLADVRPMFAVDDAVTDIRTPKAPDTPRFNGAVLYGARPGHPFVYRIAASGMRPMSFSVKGLPASLKVDAASGIITGTTPQQVRSYPLTFTAKNGVGKASRKFTLVVGDKLSLTPQMGWNDWYTHYAKITDADMRAAADAMVASGMADYGYQFVDLDDTWERRPGATDATLGGPVRDAQGHILPNSKFPDMKAMTDHIHSLGLRAGIYSSPGPLTCGGYAGSLGHEADDAQQYAQWGFDLLKYDLCSYGKLMRENHLTDFKAPYVTMGKLIHDKDRDIVLNLCEYGYEDVWKWGTTIGGQSWRTTGDVGPKKATTLPGFYSVGFATAKLSDFAGPGGWNDPDYLIIGTAGDAMHSVASGKHTSLTPAEQYSYMSMWSLMASPLFFSGDMTKLDAFTLNVLENNEVIDVDQDPLGKQAKVLWHTADDFVLVKPMADGSTVVGLFNLSAAARDVSVEWKDLGVNGKMKVRDVWRQKTIGAAKDRFTSTVGPHDVMMVRLTK